MSRRLISGMPNHLCRSKRCVVGLSVVAVLLGVTTGCGLNDPVMAKGTGLKKNLKNREETEIKSRRFVRTPLKSRT